MIELNNLVCFVLIGWWFNNLFNKFLNINKHIISQIYKINLKLRKMYDKSNKHIHPKWKQKVISFSVT